MKMIHHYSMSKIINDHIQISRQKGRDPKRLVDVWIRSNYFIPKTQTSYFVSSLVITAFDLYLSLFGDCAYSIFSEIEGTRPMNSFQIPMSQYRDLTRWIKETLIVKKCSVRTTFRNIAPDRLDLLSEIAYKLTVSRVWDVKQRSLDPVYTPSCPLPDPEIEKEVVVYSQVLAPYLISDIVDLVLIYCIDPCLPNHIRCANESKDGTRCNRVRDGALLSCRAHKNLHELLSNHYLV